MMESGEETTGRFGRKAGEAPALLEGAYDLHVHTNPSHFNRSQDDFELARTLDRYHMAGAVIKVHYGATQSRAILTNNHSGAKAKLYGAVTLDWPVGGLNPYAVESELLLGAKMVWLPTFHAKNHMDRTPAGKSQPVNAPGISVLDQNGSLVPQVYEIMDLVRSYQAVLNTGHISAKESFAVCRAARELGVKVILTHPDNDREAVPTDMQEELAGTGVFIDRSWFNVVKGAVTAAEMADRIRRTGAEHCIMSTDFGQDRNPPAPEGLLDFVSQMLENGISAGEIRLMVRENPAELLGV